MTLSQEEHAFLDSYLHKEEEEVEEEKEREQEQEKENDALQELLQQRFVGQSE